MQSKRISLSGNLPSPKLTKYGPQVKIRPFCYFFIIIRVAEFSKNIIITDSKVPICNQIFSKQPPISLVLVYAGTPTIYTNFRTFIRLYLIIFHHYIALLQLCRSSMSRPYLTTLCCNSMSHFYVAPTSHCYHLAPSHRHCLVSLHVTSQVIGPSRAVRSTTP
jgi:hypothetical protein